MNSAATSLPARRWILFALVALLGLTITAGGASAVASGPGHAIPAKKKCKKAKKGAASAKKKKCKKKRPALPVTPVQLPPAPAPIVRATLSWSADVEVDLHAFDSSGDHSGWVNGTGVVQGIPNATHNGDAGPGGPFESFTDNIFVAGGLTNREFAYVACIYDVASATFTEVTSDGQTLSTPPLSGPGQIGLTVTGGPSVPATFTCPS
jgi:hypothetical protein